MYTPRIIRTSFDWLDDDGAKLYAISASGANVEHGKFLARLGDVKSTRRLVWQVVPHFAIFHEGLAHAYLILAWWGNDNELFTSVSIETATAWVEDSNRYSFCIYDLEVFWEERQAFIDTMYCERPDLRTYRLRRRQDWLVR